MFKLFTGILFALALTACGSDDDKSDVTGLPAPSKFADYNVVYSNIETGVEPETGNDFVKGEITGIGATVVEGTCSYSIPANAKFVRTGDRLYINDVPVVWGNLPADGQMPRDTIVGTWINEASRKDGYYTNVQIAFKPGYVSFGIWCVEVK